jgi:integrase
MDRPSQVTFGDYLAEWLEIQRSRVQPSTWESYRLNVNDYLCPALGDVALDELTAAQLSSFYARLQRDGGARRRPLALATVQRAHAVAHKALKDAVRLDLLDRNVAVNATLPRLDLRGDGVAEINAWSAEELRRFLDHTRGSPLHPLWLVAASTGLRRGELLGLRWDDVDLDAGVLAVRRALSVVRERPRLKQPKTSRCRTLRLDTVTVTTLREQRDRQRRDQAANEQTWCNEWNLVFTDATGRYLVPDSVSHGFRVAVRKAPVRRVRLHDLRHTHATLLLQAGVPVKVVSERLGHAQISLTLDIYAHVLPAMDADAADRFAAAVFGA